MAEKIEELARVIDSLDDLDKEAWMEIIDRAEFETGKKLETAVDEGMEEGRRVWKEMFPYVEIIRFKLASDTLSRLERSKLIGAVFSDISGLMSPVELAGLCYVTAFNALCSSGKPRPPMLAMIPLGAIRPKEEEKNRLAI